MIDCVEDVASSVEGRLDELNSVDDSVAASRPAQGQSDGRKKIHMASDRAQLSMEIEKVVFR